MMIVAFPGHTHLLYEVLRLNRLLTVSANIRGSRMFCQRGSNFDIIFLVDEGREYPNTTVSRPSLARKRNAV